ncbi:MAG: T9SS type A sorting domain-containing protein, partial [Bacteroidetes bacterium]|nr:T9SS type A sorting domain-containing protein [Bacteroidota bacterium]
GGEDIMHFISGGPFRLEPGEKDTLTFAIMGNKSLAGLKQSVDEAKLVYDCVVLRKGPVNEFYVSDSIAYIGKPVQLGDNNPSATTWFWDFGDGTQASTPNPQHTYSGTGYYKISLTVSDGECTFTSSQWIQAVAPTDIEADLEDWKIALYPNPGSEFMTLELESSHLGELDLYLLDINGREVWKKTVVKGSQNLSEKLDVSQLPAGLYLLKINGKAYRDYRKVVIR